MIDYYRQYPLNVDVIEKMNDEYHLLEEENKNLKKELEFINSIIIFSTNRTFSTLLLSY